MRGGEMSEFTFGMTDEEETAVRALAGKLLDQDRKKREQLAQEPPWLSKRERERAIEKDAPLFHAWLTGDEVVNAEDVDDYRALLPEWLFTEPEECEVRLVASLRLAASTDGLFIEITRWDYIGIPFDIRVPSAKEILKGLES
jgi:hypothetical protein